MKNKLYLAYGSNINMEQMAYRCPTATVFGECEVQDYEMTFRGHNYRGGVANIEPKKGANVKALIWNITPADEASLDRYEGYPHLYKKIDLEVDVDGVTVTVMAYVMTDGYKLATPSGYYYDVIAQGYRDCGWDERILAGWVMRNVNRMKKEMKGK